MITTNAGNPDTAREMVRRVRAGQVESVYRQLPPFLFSSVVTAILTAVGLWTWISRPALTLWVLLIIGLSWVCYRWLQDYRVSHPISPDRSSWAGRLVIGIGLHGALWGGAGFYFFVSDSIVHQTLLLFVLAVMSGASFSTLSPLRGVYLLFLLPAFLPYAVRIFSAGDSIHLLMGSIVLLFMTLMWIISERIHASVTESLRLQFSNLDIIDDLTRARQEMARRQELAEAEARRKAQSGLQRYSEHLERRVEERTEELARSNERLLFEKELFRTTLASIGDGVITIDSNRNITYLNPAAERYTGWPSSEAQGVPLDKVFRVVDKSAEGTDADGAEALSTERDDRRHLNLVLMDRQGQKRYISYSKAPNLDSRGIAVGTVVTFRDITEERRLAQQLSHQATHDALTGLTNRREFERRLSRIAQSANPLAPHALIYIDLDQFKIVNDTCGHIAGDELLRQIAALMSTRIRTRDTFARLGGDEFGILLEHCPRDEAIRIAQTLRELSQNFRFGWQDKSFTVTLSVGLVSITDIWGSAASLLRAADSACYAAKDSGRNRVCLFEPDDHVATRRLGEMQWMSRIQQTLAEGRLRLYLQPILPTNSNEEDIELGEVLLRLLDEQGRIVLPGAFLPAAERYGYMSKIDRWVVGETFTALKALNTDRRGPLLSINLSGQSLSDENFLDFVVEQIKASHVKTPSIGFEITETAAISDFTRVRAFITTVKELGCRLSLDDFGSGLSSFGYLKNLPVDYLKIDGHFVKEILIDRVDGAMVEAIHRLGHVLGLKSIAEWVENAEILEKLTGMRVDYVQGFHLAVPRPI
ncbi:MAG: diguanylate cyclase/phosphodiesterase with sensor(s) [Acidobacteria bacterium]|jgi:diguanylate cyclase (GGDEF)-like protein/PAS domain S-box-containing protein|nr:diguanylate cyclase/phosphodiesterase with sensor(s) [Acidobacteriota bacterium]